MRGKHVVIGRVTAEDGPLIKRLRLRALEIDPLSFGSTLAGEVVYSDSQWAEWAHEGASGEDKATLIAVRGAQPVGMVAGYRDESQRSLFHVIAMWVAPEARREGIGRRLLQEIESWIEWCGGTSIQLSVSDAAEAASDLYEKAGYRPDGERSASPHTPGVTHTSLRKQLGGRRRAEPER
jgi:ribosomal protein S18 acetylase RimI-like enzyme